MPTDALRAGGPGRAGRPAPLDGVALEAVPGVLGELARRRARDAAASALRPTPRPRIAAAATNGLRAAAAGRAERGVAPAVIAEVKRASPSQGVIADLDPVATAQAYAAGGASAISVLTEPHRFGGRLDHLADVAHRVRLPTLRKDFVVHPDMVDEAVAAGARGVLLIVAVLQGATAAYLAYAERLGLDALVEVHDEGELEVALDAGAGLIGVNNRDLRTLAIDLTTAPRLAALGRARAPEVTWVAESGYRSATELFDLHGRVDAVLIGTHLAGHPDPARALADLLGRP